MGIIRVTAIVSTYNSQHFINGCMDDLISQTLFNRGELEILVVNSGSQEGEREIVERYQKDYDNITLLNTEREPLYMAWNRGIAAAKGAYVTNANTDDRHREDAFEIQAAELDKRPDVVQVYADSYITKNENEMMKDCNPVGHFAWPDYDHIQLIHTACCGPHPMWRKEAHEKLGWYHPAFPIAGDYEWWLRMAEHYQFYHIPEILGLYLDAETSMESANFKKSQMEADIMRAWYAFRAGVLQYDYDKYKRTFMVYY